LQFTIEKLVYGGDGLARGPAGKPGRGKAVFIPFVLPGERVEAAVAEEKPGFMRARAEKILEAAPQRVQPHCPYFQACGGCHYQHTGYDQQLRIKTAILQETVRRLAKIDPPEIRAHASPPWHYRNRARLKVRVSEPDNLGSDARRRQEFALGYYRFNSHELLPVEHCPISSPLINRAIAAVWQLGREGMVSNTVQEIEFFANAEDTRLLAELTLPDNYWKLPCKPSEAIFVRELRRILPEIAGVAAFRNAASGGEKGQSTAAPERLLVREEVPKKLKEIFGDDELVYHTHCCEFHVSAGSFFQTNRYLTDTLVELVTANRSGDVALDLYAGAGLFTLPLSQNFRKVVAVESAPFSFHDLRRNTPSNVQAHRRTTESFLVSADELGTAVLGLVVVDPPRAGLGEAVASRLGRLQAGRLTYVSCDPSTLARDLKTLLASGFRIEEMHLVDLFPQTFHIESVTQLVR
jgi:23S rRNA (uracil1939-C5)-methyltransferase